MTKKKSYYVGVWSFQRVEAIPAQREEMYPVKAHGCFIGSLIFDSEIEAQKALDKIVTSMNQLNSLLCAHFSFSYLIKNQHGKRDLFEIYLHKSSQVGS